MTSLYVKVFLTTKIVVVSLILGVDHKQICVFGSREESDVAGYFVFSHIRNTDDALFKVWLGKG